MIIKLIGPSYLIVINPYTDEKFVNLKTSGFTPAQINAARLVYVYEDNKLICNYDYFGYGGNYEQTLIEDLAIQLAQKYINEMKQEYTEATINDFFDKKEQLKRNIPE